MIINGAFIRYTKRNEKTGQTRFGIRTETGKVICDGKIQNYPFNIPLEITGEYKDGMFQVQFSKPCFYNKEDTKRFLLTKLFAEVGQVSAEKISTIPGEELYKNCMDETTWKALSEDVGIPFQTLCNTFKIIKSYIAFDELLKFVIGKGGDYYSVKKLTEHFGEGAADAIHANPYVMLYSGTNFVLCEQMAKEYGMHACDKKRVHAIMEYLLIQNEKNGNTKMAFHEICEKFRKLENDAKCGFVTSFLFLGEELLNDEYVYEIINDDIMYVYLRQTYHAEKMIARNAKRLSVSKIVHAADKCFSVEQIEKICGISYSSEQKNTFEAPKTSGIKFIIGGPGTGKTATLNGLLKKITLEHPKATIALCAPTGRAAQIMKDGTGREAETIHKKLDIRPYEADILSNITKLDADYIFVDEFSMVDTMLMARLLSSLKNGATLILIGDADQLPSVGAGNVLADMIKSGFFEVYRLTEIFRQENGSLIIENSRRIIKGDRRLKTDKNFVIKRFRTEMEMADYAIEAVRSCINKNINDYKLFTPVRNHKYVSGSVQLNRRIHEMCFTEDESVTYGFYSFAVGDKVLFNTNNYQKGYYNGQEGVISDIQKHTGTTRVSVTTDEGTIFLNGTELDDLELDYALTAHKSQGGECRNALILVPKRPSSMLQRRLLYVEVTRARKNVMILSEENALDIAISTCYETVRMTGLTEKLIAEFESAKK